MRVPFVSFLTLLVLAAVVNVTEAQGNPNPRISTISPNTHPADGTPFDVVITGSNFRDNAVVRWNGFDRATQRVSDSELKVRINGGDVAQAGTASVTVAQLVSQQLRVSDPMDFTVTPVASSSTAPAVTGLVPSSRNAGSGGFELVVNGSGFTQGASVRWNGAGRTTTFDSPSRLRATIPASDVAAPGAAQVTVVNTGGSASGSRSFVVRVPTPTISSITPSTVARGGADFTLTVNGSNYMSAASSVRWKGAVRPTQFVSATQLRATIPAADISSLGDASVTVVTSVATNAGQMTETSGAATVTVLEPAAPVATVVTVALALSARNFFIGGPSNPERVFAGDVPLSVAHTGATPTHWRVSSNEAFFRASWQPISAPRIYPFSASNTGERTLYFQYRYLAGDQDVRSNVVSDKVVVRPAFTTNGVASNLRGSATGTHHRLVCPEGQMVTGFRVRQTEVFGIGRWVDGIGLVCAGANRAMVGRTSGETLLPAPETNCSASQVAWRANLSNPSPGAPGALTAGTTYLGFMSWYSNYSTDSRDCPSAPGGGRYDPLYAKAVSGSQRFGVNCDKDAGQFPIGLDVYLNAIGVTWPTTIQLRGLAGIGYICAQPD